MKKKRSEFSIWILILTLVFFILGIYLLSPSFTGNVIGQTSKLTTNIFGIVLIVLGIGGYYFFAKFSEYF